MSKKLGSTQRHSNEEKKLAISCQLSLLLTAPTGPFGLRRQRRPLFYSLWAGVDSSKAFLFPTPATTVQPLSYIDFGVNALGRRRPFLLLLLFFPSHSIPPFFLIIIQSSSYEEEEEEENNHHHNLLSQPNNASNFPQRRSIPSLAHRHRQSMAIQFPPSIPPSSSHSPILQRFIGLKCWPRGLLGIILVCLLFFYPFPQSKQLIMVQTTENATSSPKYFVF